MKIVKTGNEARKKLIKGASFMAEAVSSTLGPFGTNAALEKHNKITNDGVTIAREIALKDEIEERGVRILRESAIKTDEMAGDGTTTAMTLALAILKEVVKFLPRDNTVIGKKTPSEISKQIDQECAQVVDKLKELSTPITSVEELIEVAKVSAEDEDLAKLIGEAQWRIGKDGVILAEEVNDPVSSLEYIEGIRIDNGLGASIVMNNEEKQALELSDTPILLTSHVVQSLIPLKPALEQLVKSGVKSVIIVARAFSEQAIKDCLANFNAGFPVYPINAPFTDMVEIFKDLQAILGGRFINNEETPLEDVNVSDFGLAKKLDARRYTTVFAGNSDNSRIDTRLKELALKAKGSPSEFEKKNIATRTAQLKNGLALLKIGAPSVIERQYKKDKADDAVNSVRAALQEGTVAGAGQTLKQISESLPEGSILKIPLLSVYQQIISSAPNEFVIPEWVRDSVKVLRIALVNACSAAKTLATATIVIVNEREKPRLMQEVDKNTAEPEVEV